MPVDTPTDVARLLPRLDAAIGDLDSLCTFVREEEVVHRPRIMTFFAQYPLDMLLCHLHTRCDLLRTDAELHDLLADLATADGIDLPRFACGIASVLLDALCSAPRVPALVARCIFLLSVVAYVDAELLNDLALFRTLATYAHGGSSTTVGHLLAFVHLGGYAQTTVLVEDLYVALLRRVVRRGESDDALEAQTLVAVNPELRSERYVEETVQLWRTGWPAPLGTLVATLLDTPCVALVVRLDRIGKLEDLVRTAHAAHTACPHWSAVHALLRGAYATRVAEILGDPAPAPETDAGAECPITLVRMQRPVVASDGHTYERDALMRHFVVNGFTSPLTRERVAPVLYPNRALLARA